MIKHVVLLNFRRDVSAQERAAIFAQLADLKSVIPGFRGMIHGPNVSPEGLHKGYNDAFIIDFEDAWSRDVYLSHPDHKAAGAGLVAALEGGRDGLVVFDIEG